ncbi:hypothetical protein [Microbacterium sp. C7(2022)]|uniref:hypothetical protein n=1 Tax=Microbacterium sp. C7(2022) TaxID=2992759 RepID=UPI00237BBEA8|nr:hypothetical protein [Microbacterium sp. C7(2022)]MDE0545077.1 hypothetical protein [Microbacterium sp. C7(2022)]
MRSFTPPVTVIDHAAGGPGNEPLRTALAQATYDGTPGHPVIIGSAHFAALVETLDGDRGAGLYLRAHGALRVECGDLWSGADVDRPSARND